MGCKDQCEGYMRSTAVLEMRKGKGKGKGKPSKCPPVATIIEETAQKFACEICHFTEMGWIDSEMVADETLIEEDIMTLPSEISEALPSEEDSDCMNTMQDDAMGFHNKCMDSYSEDEQSELFEVSRGVAHTECFKGMFEKGCGDYIENTIDAMAGMNSGSGSGSGSGSEMGTIFG